MSTHEVLASERGVILQTRVIIYVLTNKTEASMTKHNILFIGLDK